MLEELKVTAALLAFDKATAGCSSVQRAFILSELLSIALAGIVLTGEKPLSKAARQEFLSNWLKLQNKQVQSRVEELVAIRGLRVPQEPKHKM